MKTQVSLKPAERSFGKLVWYHFYPGILIILFYLLVTPLLMADGFPGITGLLTVELLVLAPVALIHLKNIKRQQPDQPLFPYVDPLTWKQYLFWGLMGILGCILIYAPLYPVGIWLRETAFSWLPHWFFDPLAGTATPQLLGYVMISGVLIDGIIGPVAEELYFRGYLLPRMSFLKHWAPIVNGLLFGLYHFWQPHNYAAVVAVGIIISTVVWKKKNLYLGIIIHCTINILGAIASYLAVTSGEGLVR